MTQQIIHRCAWIASMIISAILLLLLIIIFQNAYYYHSDSKDIKLKNNAQVTEYLNNTWLNKYTLKPPIYVPTGIYINDLNFKSANDMIVVLYIWQHYPNNIPNYIKPEFYIMEQVEFTNKLVLYDEKNEKEEVTGTYVEVKTRQQFDYHRYPFDDKIVYISIWPKNYADNIILVPDFPSYHATPDSLIGIYPYVRLRGFLIKDSYFGYQTSDYDATFGQHQSIDKYGYPYFYFALVLKRSLFSAFVLHVLPLLIAYLLLFCILLMSSERREKFDRFHFTGTMAIINISAVFFVLVVIHIGLRMKIYSNQILYLEYFYFLLYLLMALIVLNYYILLSDTKKKIKWLHYGDNLISKVLFWPIILCMAVFISIKELL